MKCPHCSRKDSKVIESRELDEGSSIRRRRQCLACQYRFTTYERVEPSRLMVIKKDGSRELFDRQKLSSGIYKSLEKRPVSQAKIEQLISAVEKEIKSRDEDEVSTSDIGELVMDKLLKLDDVAYVRFASVYRSFTDLKSFEKVLEGLKKRHR